MGVLTRQKMDMAQEDHLQITIGLGQPSITWSHRSMVLWIAVSDDQKPVSFPSQVK